MFGQIDEIKNLAFKYSKQQLGRMVQMGMIDPQKAMMAGMMRDRVSKEDTKPPTTTVAQDILAPQQPQQQQMGMQQPQQPQPQQMGMPPQAPPQEPTQMAATGGVTSLPVQEQDYAGGGIVAFADGGTADLMRQQVMDDYGLFAESATPEQITAAQNKQQLQQRADQLKSQMLYGRPNDATKTEYANIVKQLNQPAAPVTPMAPPASTFAAPTGVAAAPGAPKPAVDRPAPPVSGAPAAPRLPALNRPSGKIDIQEYNAATPKDIDTILAEQQGVYKKQGLEDPYKGLMDKEEGKRAGLGKRKEEAKGEFLMNLGIGLTKAKRGREGEALGEGAERGLASYKDSMKDVRATEEKLDDRINAYKLAEYQAKKTGTDAAIAKRDSMLDKVEAAKIKNIDARNTANAEQAKIQANIYGTETQANTARYVAGVQASTQRDYTAALKAQGLDVQRQRILIDAASDYVSKNADKPAYIGKPELLQADAIAFSKNLAAQMGVMVPGGGNQMVPTPTPTADMYQKTYGITPTKG